MSDHQAAEDIVQETFLRAFKAYDGYEERGRERKWLATIARNVALTHLGRRRVRPEVNLSAANSDEAAFADLLLTPAPSAEEIALADEFTSRVIDVIRSLPDSRRNIFFYRYIHDLTVKQTAALMGQPAGSVKSGCHYAVRRIRKDLSRYFVEGGYVVSCKDVYLYLFQYAQDAIQPDDRITVERHLSVCDDWGALASSLRVLTQNMEPAHEESMRHYVISIQLESDLELLYFGLSSPVEDHDRLNALLAERNGVIPPNETWFTAGHNAEIEHLAEFDNEGNRIELELMPDPNNPNNVRYRYRRMVRVYPRHTMASVGLSRRSSFAPSPQDPRLVVGKVQNHLGTAARSGLYLALPGSAKNVRILRGDGVIDAGPYLFAYADRYIAEDERIARNARICRISTTGSYPSHRMIPIARRHQHREICDVSGWLKTVAPSFRRRPACLSGSGGRYPGS